MDIRDKAAESVESTKLKFDLNFRVTLVQRATTNEFLFQLAVGAGTQTKRSACNDMVNVDEIIKATYKMERYIDALSGGPEKSWFRIVSSPEEARAGMKSGNLDIVLGVETSVLFRCFLVPSVAFDKCTESDVPALFLAQWMMVSAS